MGKLTKTGIAIVLGMALSLSMFTGGAFAQSANQSAASGGVSAAVAANTLQGPEQGHGNGWGDNQGHGNQWGGNQWHGNQWGGNQWHGNGWRGEQGHGECGWNARCGVHHPVRCERVGRWGRNWGGFRHMSLSCRRW